jgi:hypothetical protein
MDDKNIDLVIHQVRLWFPLPEEEQIAVALMQFLVMRIGDQVLDLRPDSIMGEVLDLAKAEEWTTAEFGHMLELAGLEAFDDELEQMTFREFVRYAASRKSIT